MSISFYPHGKFSENFVCTSTTRPSNPYVGQYIFETDTVTYLMWDGTYWIPVWPVPILTGGRDISFDSTAGDFVADSVSISALPYPAKIRFYVSLSLQPTTGDATDWQVQVRDGPNNTGTPLGGANHRATGVNNRFHVSFTTEWYNLTPNFAQTFYLQINENTFAGSISTSDYGINRWHYEIVGCRDESSVVGVQCLAIQ